MQTATIDTFEYEEMVNRFQDLLDAFDYSGLDGDFLMTLVPHMNECRISMETMRKIVKDLRGLSDGFEKESLLLLFGMFFLDFQTNLDSLETKLADRFSTN